MEVVSLFSGCGGTDLGFEQAGHQIIWSNDSDKRACQTYELNFGFSPNQGDIKEQNRFPKAQLLIGCYPCQGFSLYGKREVEDPRNYLYLEFIRALKQVKPKYFVTENVKGLMYGYGATIYEAMIKEFRRVGYNSYKKLINAKSYGIPQDRERVFIVGVREDITEEYVFPEPTHDPGLSKYVSMRKAIGGMAKPRDVDVYWGSFSSHYMSRNRKRKWGDVSYTIQASGRHAPLHPSGNPMIYVGKDQWVFGEGENRRLSYKECARIQTFPKSYKFSGTLDEKYRQIGNAVPPLLAKAFAETFQ
jgi:DNA (cytosine-5)-methyltransferase 1